MPPFTLDPMTPKVDDSVPLILPRICGREKASDILLSKEDRDHAQGAKDLYTRVEARSCAIGSDQREVDRAGGPRAGHFGHEGPRVRAKNWLHSALKPILPADTKLIKRRRSAVSHANWRSSSRSVTS